MRRFNSARSRRGFCSVVGVGDNIFVLLLGHFVARQAARGSTALLLQLAFPVTISILLQGERRAVWRLCVNLYSIEIVARSALLVVILSYRLCCAIPVRRSPYPSAHLTNSLARLVTVSSSRCLPTITSVDPYSVTKSIFLHSTDSTMPCLLRSSLVWSSSAPNRSAPSLHRMVIGSKEV